MVLDDSDLEDFYSNDFLDDSDSDESESDSNWESNPSSESVDRNASPEIENVWTKPALNFSPRKEIPTRRSVNTTEKVTCMSSVIEIFLKLFPISLFVFIAQCTNARLRKMKTNVKETDCYEIMTFLGCSFIMCYNSLI